MASGAVGAPSQRSPHRSTPAPAGDRDEPAGVPGTDDQPAVEKIKEIGGPRGPEPTRYGDWEKGGRCSDF